MILSKNAFRLSTYIYNKAHQSLIKTVAFCVVLLAVPNAWANDTSFAAIEVESINTNAKVNTEISFKGQEAKKLMQLLPKISTTGGPIIEEHNRVLQIKSPGYMITLDCSDVEFDLIVGSNAPKFKTPECTIFFGKRIDESDNLLFEPEKQCK